MSALTRRLAIKMSLLFGGFLLVIIAAFFARSYAKEHRDLEERFGLALERIVATAAPEIDGDAHTALDGREDVGSPVFAQTRAILRRVQQVNYLRENAIYTFNIITAEKLRWAVMLQADAFRGDTYDVVPQNVERVCVAFPVSIT